MSSKVMDVLDGLFVPNTPCIIYFWKPQVKPRSMIKALVILTPIRKTRMILMSSKVTDVPDGLFWFKDPTYHIFSEISGKMYVNDYHYSYP